MLQQINFLNKPEEEKQEARIEATEKKGPNPNLKNILLSETNKRSGKERLERIISRGNIMYKDGDDRPRIITSFCETSLEINTQNNTFTSLRQGIERTEKMTEEQAQKVKELANKFQPPKAEKTEATEEKKAKIIEFDPFNVKVKEEPQEVLYLRLEDKQKEIYRELQKIDGITVEIVGRWIWCDGNTKENKDKLRALGLKFSGPRQKWYLRDSNTTKYRRPSKKSYQEIKDEYNKVIASEDK